MIVQKITITFRDNSTMVKRSKTPTGTREGVFAFKSLTKDFMIPLDVIKYVMIEEEDE